MKFQLLSTLAFTVSLVFSDVIKLTAQQSIELESSLKTAQNLVCIPKPPYIVNVTQVIQAAGTNLYDNCDPNRVIVTFTAGSYNLTQISSQNSAEQCVATQASSSGLKGKDSSGAQYVVFDQSAFVSSYNLSSPILDQDFTFDQITTFHSIANGQNARAPGQKGATKGQYDKQTFYTSVKCDNCPYCQCAFSYFINSEQKSCT